jgi:GNAT superfamily N-acetyltransferase
MVIRDPAPSDETAWRRLWAGYVAFYEAEIADNVTAETWRRMLEPGSGFVARLADENGSIQGFTVSVLHPGTWSTAPVCYLEDLFVDPTVRGKGVGRALIDDLIAMAHAKGWSRLYWHTRASNATARRLYDRFVQADDFVRYRLIF